MCDSAATNKKKRNKKKISTTSPSRSENQGQAFIYDAEKSAAMSNINVAVDCGVNSDTPKQKGRLNACNLCTHRADSPTASAACSRWNGIRFSLKSCSVSASPFSMNPAYLSVVCAYMRARTHGRDTEGARQKVPKQRLQ